MAAFHNSCNSGIHKVAPPCKSSLHVHFPVLLVRGCLLLYSRFHFQFVCFWKNSTILTRFKNASSTKSVVSDSVIYAKPGHHSVRVTDAGPAWVCRCGQAGEKKRSWQAVWSTKTRQVLPDCLAGGAIVVDVWYWQRGHFLQHMQSCLVDRVRLAAYCQSHSVYRALAPVTWFVHILRNILCNIWRNKINGHGFVDKQFFLEIIVAVLTLTFVKSLNFLVAFARTTKYSCGQPNMTCQLSGWTTGIKNLFRALLNIIVN